MKYFTARNFLFYLLLFAIGTSISSCAWMFYPKKQLVTIKTDNDSALVFVDSFEVAAGLETRERILKQGDKELVVVTPGYKDTYAALPAYRKRAGYFALATLNVFNFFGLLVDGYIIKGWSYAGEKFIPIPDLIPVRDNTQKYISLENISLQLDDWNTDFILVEARFSADYKKQLANNKKKEAKILAQIDKEKKENGTVKRQQNVSLNLDETRITQGLRHLIVMGGYADSVKKIFTPANTTLLLDGRIKKVTVYRPYRYDKTITNSAKLNVTWYIKNPFLEIIDSIEVESYSGEFLQRNEKRAIADAVQTAYIILLETEKMQQHLKMQIDLMPQDPTVEIEAPGKQVKTMAEATLASVIVKTDRGHGSGFAVSNSGYIVTSYSLVASKYEGMFEPVTVVNSDGREFPAKVVRSNVHKDLALLKVDTSFAYCFRLSNEKRFKALMNVYTIGAPAHMELGQSVTPGIISNERKVSGSSLIQLSMPVHQGNCGGPLFDADMNLHGLLVTKLVGFRAEGICFAFPAYEIAQHLGIAYK